MSWQHYLMKGVVRGPKPSLEGDGKRVSNRQPNGKGAPRPLVAPAGPTGNFPVTGAALPPAGPAGLLCCTCDFAGVLGLHLPRGMSAHPRGTNERPFPSLSSPPLCVRSLRTSTPLVEDAASSPRSRRGPRAGGGGTSGPSQTPLRWGTMSRPPGGRSPAHADRERGPAFPAARCQGSHGSRCAAAEGFCQDGSKGRKGSSLTEQSRRGDCHCCHSVLGSRPHVSPEQEPDPRP